jgi:MFS family permease
MAFGQRRLDRGLAFQQPVECIVKFALIDLAEAELSAEARCGGGRRRHPMRCSLPAFTEPGRPCVLLLGPLPSRLGTARVLTVCLACGIVIIAAVALGRLPYLILLVAIVTMGICVVGGQLGANGLSAPKYPARIRTTGIGWVLGIGRLDGIVGSGLGGFLLGQGWQPPHILLCACLTAAVAAICVVQLQLPAKRVAGEPIPRGMMRAPSALSPPGYLAALPITTAAWTTQCGPYAAATTVMPVTCSSTSWHMVVRPARARSLG